MDLEKIIKELKKRISEEAIDKSVYESILSNFQKYTNSPLMKKKSEEGDDFSVVGSKVTDGALNVDGSVSVSGKLQVKGGLECQNVNIFGSVRVEDSLTVLEKLNVYGKVIVEGGCKIGGKTSISGTMKVSENAVLLKEAKVTGKLTIRGELISGDNLKVSGKLSASELKCSETVDILGGIKVEGNLISNKFKFSYGGGSPVIQGSLKAREIEVRSSNFGGVANFGDTAFQSKIANIVQEVLNKTNIPEGRRLLVKQNVEGSKIKVNHLTVEGDIIGDEVHLGSDVEVMGVVKYKTSCTMPEGKNFETVKIDI